MHLRIKICYFRLCKFRKWLSLTKIFTSASVVRESSSVSQLPVVTHKTLMNYPKLCLHLSRFFGWPRRKAGRKKLVYRLIRLFSSTEIFSKRRKIYAWWRKTRVTSKLYLTEVCWRWLAHASGVYIYPLCACAPSSKICESLDEAS